MKNGGNFQIDGKHSLFVLTEEKGTEIKAADRGTTTTKKLAGGTIKLRIKVWREKSQSANGPQIRFQRRKRKEDSRVHSERATVRFLGGGKRPYNLSIVWHVVIS